MAAPEGPVTTTQDASVLVLADRLDALRALELRPALDALVEHGRAADAGRVVVDLAAVDFVDSAALAALVRLRRVAGEAGLDLVLVRPRREDALRVFRLTQFDVVFTMVDRREDAASGADGGGEPGR